MGDSKKEKEKKPSFFKGVKSEFSKVSWPGRNDYACGFKVHPHCI